MSESVEKHCLIDITNKQIIGDLSLIVNIVMSKQLTLLYIADDVSHSCWRM